MAKNNQKREKAARNKKNALKYRKKSTKGRGRFGAPRPASPFGTSTDTSGGAPIQ